MVGSTDTHTGLATAEEENFFGKHSGVEPSAHRWEDVVLQWKNTKLMGWEMAASGYAGVWAKENTREALWDAMKRNRITSYNVCYTKLLRSKPRALLATTCPIRPNPRIPSRFPVTWVPTMKAGLQSFHARVRTSRSPSLARLAAPSMSIMVNSAVASDSTSGVFVTMTPFALAAFMSTWS